MAHIVTTTFIGSVLFIDTIESRKFERLDTSGFVSNYQQFEL